ncbi:hypothetical protein TRE132_16720 [Pseudomonas chlororaphis subsp. aurantiaca]|nr:hypothetical protein TRE132_16720 [Pseudomonas chlororaphis subsp. aurantiaca]
MDIRKSGLVSSGDSGSYSDLNRLNQLKVGDKNSDANMRKVAQEFESLFLNEMLKSMRSATEALGKDNPLNTPAAKQYQEMYDQQLAVSMSREGGGIGLADVLMRQMSKNKSTSPAAAATLPGAQVDKVATPTAIAAGTTALGGPLSRSMASVRCGLPARWSHSAPPTAVPITIWRCSTSGAFPCRAS